jgi:hypothetical protein
MTSVLAQTWLTEDDCRRGDLEAVLSLLARGSDGAELEREPAADEARRA